MEEQIKVEPQENMTPEQAAIAKCVTDAPWYGWKLKKIIRDKYLNTDFFGEEFEAWCKTPEGMRYAE